MRIDAFNLGRFGPFTDVNLDFSQGDHGLHVVYGGNRAGKSSSLRALQAALFGIDARTEDNFVHQYSALRLGMTLRNAAGESMTFVRRKANKNALRDAAGRTPLPVDALQPFLCGVDAEEFKRVFTLNQPRLQTGARQLLDDDADRLAAAIVGAALGVNDLRRVQQRLDAEAKELFSSRSTRAQINVAINEWRQQEQMRRTQSISGHAWHEARQTADRCGRERDDATRHEADVRRQVAELEFVRRNRPRVARLKMLRVQLADLNDTPLLPEGFAERSSKAQLAREAELVSLERLKADEDGSRAKLDAQPSVFALLDQATEIEDLHNRASIVADAGKGQKEQRSRIGRYEKERCRIANRVGLSLRAGDRGDDDLPLTVGEAGPDCGRLERSLDKALEHRGLDKKRLELGEELKDLDLKLAEGVTRLPGYKGGIDGLLGMTVVGPKALVDFQRRFEHLEEEDRRSRKDEEAARRRRGEIDTEVVQLSGDGAVPSEDTLQQFRGRRDQQWRLVRRAWLENRDVGDEAREIDADHSLPESFERSLLVTDEVADRMRRASDRVAQMAELERQKQSIDRELEERARTNENREERRVALEAEWHTAWDGSGLEVQRWPSMRDTLDIREQLVGQLERRKSLQVEIEQVDGTIADVCDDLRAAMAAVGELVEDDESRLEALIELATLRKVKLAEAREEFAELRVKSTAAAGRIRSMKDNEERFTQRVEEFRSRYLSEQPAESPVETVRAIVDALEATKREEQAYRDAKAQFAEVEKKRGATDEKVRLATVALEVLAAEAGAGSFKELPEIVRLADQKRYLSNQVEEIQGDLLNEGCPVEETARRVAAHTETETTELQERLSELTRALTEATADAAKKRERAAAARSAFEGLTSEDDTVAAANANMASIEAGLGESVQRYLRLVLASGLLREAIERYRQHHEAPLLAKASTRFSNLTNGDYDRVETDVDDAGSPFFLVHLAGGDTTNTFSQLSEGTRGQLQLALVLGSLEQRFAAGAEPMPLVLDDVLVDFDDDHSLAAIGALAAFSKTTQVLLLTHHSRIREQAESLVATQDVFLQSI